MPARVHAVQALVDFRAAMVSFAHQAKNALGSGELDLSRVIPWLESQRHLWLVAQRKAEDDVLQAKNELARRRWMAAGGDRQIDCTEQEKALRKAQMRLEWIVEKLERTRDWQRDYPHAQEEYDGRARPLLDVLESDVPRMIAMLDRMIHNLEAYAQLAPPSSGEKK